MGPLRGTTPFNIDFILKTISAKQYMLGSDRSEATGDTKKVLFSLRGSRTGGAVVYF